jgi:signal transduction histidine kinase
MVHYLVACLVDFAIVFLALSKRNNPAAKALALTALSMGLWSLELFLLTIIQDLPTLTLWFHLTRWGMFFIAPCIALLVWNLMGRRSKKFLYFTVIPSFIFAAIISLSNLLLFPSELIPATGGYLPKVDAIFYCFAIGFIYSLLSAISFCALKFKSATHREKQKIRWLLATIILILILGAISIYLVKYNFYLKLVGAVANIGCISLLFYATVQNHLMDVRSAVSMGMARALILAVIIWGYFYVVELIGMLNESIGGAAVMIVFVVVVLELYPRLLKWILPSAKKILGQQNYELNQVKGETKKAFDDSLSFKMMMDVLDHLFIKILKINNYKVLMIESNEESINDENTNLLNNRLLEIVATDDPLITYCAQQPQLIMADEMPDTMRGEMEKHRATVCFPVTLENKMLAIVLVGEATHSHYYRYDDMKIFDWLKAELGQVLERLIRLNSMQNQLAEAKKTLSMLSLMNHYHHDIKAPFAIIDGVLSNDIYDRDKQRDIVLAQVERGSKLIATMASILGGHHKRRIELCSLESLIQDCFYLFEKSFDKVEYELSGVPKIKGDAEDLKILFINLIKNSAEARRENEDLIINIKSWTESSNVYFSISDNGIGMTEDQLANLWEPGVSVKKFGSGIGMQAIKRIIDEHNARIDVTSEIAKGSEFTLCFFVTQAVRGDMDNSNTKDELAERRAANQIEKRSTL